MLKQQRGVTLVGLVVIIAVLGTFGTLAAKILPMYMENMTITSAIEESQKSIDLSKMKRSEIVAKLRKNLSVNNVTNLPEDALVVQKRGSELYIMLDYERRTSFFDQIDLVGRFSDEYRVGSS